MSKLSFRARALDASKPMPIYLAEELPDLPDYSAINRAVPQMPSGMEKEEESEHHLQRAISGTGLIIPTPEVYEVQDIEFYERCYPPDYKMPKQHIHMQPLWEEQEAPEYDIDSEDERWLKQQRHPELTELKFEQMMDKLEKSSGQTVVTLNEAKLLLERHDDLVIAVYDYWLNKRLSTQHPLILSVRTEARGGQSSNNPYLAFRRRTEKMQTRKNRKNDESSYEKMLKLRRDLARALTLLELVARREKAKRDLVKLTALLADRRYAVGDFASQLLPDPPPRPQYTVPIQPAAFRREQYTVQHFPPRAPPTPVDQPRQREKRPYKRRKHRHHAPGTVHALRDSGVYTSSEEESTPRTEDDGPFAFHRKPGCYYEMPTSTLSGDPVDPEDPKSDTFEHELDERYRYNLTSISHPYPKCIGFARRRVGRGGRLILDRIRTPLDGFWPDMPLSNPKDEVTEDLEKNRYRIPKEITSDYHTRGQHPWRHAFRKHLAREPDLWTADVKPDVKYDVDDVRAAAEDVKMATDHVKLSTEHIKTEPMDVSIEEPVKNSLKSDISDKCDSARTIDSAVKENLHRLMRKRAWSESSDSSYDSEDSLQPVEKEFEKFIDEVNTKWLHFRPKTPPASPPSKFESDDHFPITADMPITVELRPAEQPSSGDLDPFVTSEFTLNDIYPEMPNLDPDHSGSSLDISNDDLISENLGLTEAQVESILSETDLKVLDEVDDKKISEDLLEELVGDGKDCFLSQSHGGGRAANALKNNFGSTVVKVTQCVDEEPIYIEKLQIRPPTPKPALPGRKLNSPARRPPAAVVPAPAPVPVPARPQAVPLEKKPPQIRKDETIEEIQLSHNVQLKTVHTKHSPLKKHIITSSHRKPEAVASVASVASVTANKDGHAQPQIVTVAVSDSLKVRLQNHLLASQAGGNVVGLVQNGPLTSRCVAASAASTPPAAAAPRRVLQLSAPAGKLKLLHGRNMGQVPTVVSLATLGDGNQTPTAALIKPTHQLAHLFEIKGGQLGKGPHLVNVVRQGAATTKTSVARLESVTDAKKRQFVATFDPTQLKTVAAGGFGRGQRVAVSVDGRTGAGVTNATGATAGQLRHTLQLRTRLQPPRHHPAKVVANLVHKTVGGVQAVALSAAQLKRLAPHHASEIVEGGPGGVTPAAGGVGGAGAGGAGAAGAAAAGADPARDNGDALPMEVT